jgi:ActD protein
VSARTRWVLARYAEAGALLAAARSLREEGHASLDIHSPYPLPGSDEALGLKRSRVPLLALLGGLAGVASAVAMQIWMNAVDFPINVGNRLLVPRPALVPVTFELGVLLSAFAIFFGMMGLWGFPRPHHPVFEVEAFRSAAVDGLWLSAEVGAGEVERVAEALRRSGAVAVEIAPEVEA